MKKILVLIVMLLLLTACGGKAEDLQVQVDDLQVELEDAQGELDLAESAVGLCVASLEEEVTATSGLRGTLTDALDNLAASEEDLEACTVSLEEATTFSSGLEDAYAVCMIELKALSIGPEAGGGGEGEEVADEDECAGTERILMMSTPVLQQAVDKNGKPRYNANDKMIMIAIPNSRVEDFIAGDTVCVTEHYPVDGGWAVFLISGTRTADYNLFIPAHYLEPLPEEAPPFVP